MLRPSAVQLVVVVPRQGLKLLHQVPLGDHVALLDLADDVTVNHELGLLVFSSRGELLGYLFELGLRLLLGEGRHLRRLMG